MAGPHEVALGIASVLGKPGVPDPLTVSFRGQSLESASEIVRAITAECRDAGIEVAKIELDPDLYRHMIAERGHATAVPLSASDSLIGDIKIYAT